MIENPENTHKSKEIILESSLNEKEEFELIKKDIVQINKLFSPIQKIKYEDPEFLKKIDKYCRSLSHTDEIKKNLENVLLQILKYYSKIEDTKAKSFSSIFNQYKEGLSSKKISFKTLDIYRLKVRCVIIEGKSSTAEIRILYNEEVISPWTAIRTAEDIERGVSKSIEKLKKCEIPEDQFRKILLNAYLVIRTRQEKTSNPNPKLVLIKDLHKEVLIELFKHDIKNEKNLNRIFTQTLPTWTFLFNLDKYFLSSNRLPDNERLSFITGSQSETERSGMVLKGLTIESDYQKFCFLQAAF